MIYVYNDDIKIQTCTDDPDWVVISNPDGDCVYQLADDTHAIHKAAEELSQEWSELNGF